MPDTESEWNDGRENDEIEMTKLEAMTPPSRSYGAAGE